MNSHALQTLLETLLKNWENGVVEFKNVSDSFSTPELGKYFSALSNEANLGKSEKAWLILGVDDKPRQVVGSNFKKEPEQLNKLKLAISHLTQPATTFRNIYELDYGGRRVVFFEIPVAPQGIPIASNGHHYGRAGESLVALSLDKIDEIRHQAGIDWSAQIVPKATINDLDPVALQKSREAFLEKNANRFKPEEAMSWSNSVFLDRAKLTIDGKIVDPAYSKILIQQTNLSLDTILALDRVQKKLLIDDAVIKSLRQKKLIEGRKPNFYISASIASVTAKKTEYIRTRVQDDDFYIAQITSYLSQFKHATRKDVEDVLLKALSPALNDVQKKNKITNLLSKMRAKGRIKNIGSDRKPKWILIV